MIRRIVPLAVLVALAAFALASTATAAPIRVGFFKGIGSSRYWNTNIHTAGTALATLLANPDAANLGPALVKPAAGIVLSFFGLDSAQQGTPSAGQKAAFMSALDSLDVIVFPNNVGFASIFTDTVNRAKLEWFFKTRGVVSLHWTTQTTTGNPYWGAWDSLPGTLSGGWITTGSGTLRRDSAAAQYPAARFLNRGLPDTARFAEKWLSHTRHADSLRAISGLKVTMTLDSASLSSSGATRLSARQPYSWYRTIPEGGRFFYTGLGDRVELFTGAARLDSTGDTTRPANNFLRRQLYNAILWAAGVDSNGVVSVRDRASKNVSKFSDAPRIALNGGALSVSILQDGVHRIELKGLDGRRMALRKGTGKMDHTFTGLHSGVQLVVVTTTAGRQTRRVVIP
jgi:hypothetical protein